MQWPALTDEQRRKRLQFPANRVDMVLDTDTRNEVDDQFALTYLLLCPERVNLQQSMPLPFKTSAPSTPGTAWSRATTRSFVCWA